MVIIDSLLADLMLNIIDHLLIVLGLNRKITVPTTIDYSLATLFVLVGGIILWHFPEFTFMGEILIGLGIFSRDLCTKRHKAINLLDNSPTP